MARLRYNNSVGVLGASLTNSGTTITFNSAPSFATISAPDYIPLTLEPPSLSPNSNFEVVWLTAYTAGQTTGTITRGCEGTTAVAHNNAVIWACAPTTSDYVLNGVQNGVFNSGDLALSALTINTSTGALSFTLASASPCLVKDAGGNLIPLTYVGQSYTLTPGTLPTASNSRVVGVELDTNNAISLVVGSSVGGQQSTATTLETNTPAITSGKLRLADIGVYNNAGSYNFSNASTTATQGTNWVDRRPWAKGGYNRINRNTNAAGGSDYTTTSTSMVLIDSTHLAIRMECTGNPVRCCLRGRAQQSAASAFSGFGFWIDGAIADMVGTGNGLYGFSTGTTNTNVPVPLNITWEFLPSAGSHLFQPFWIAGSGTLTLFSNTSNYQSQFTVEEIVKANNSNGAA